MSPIFAYSLNDIMQIINTYSNRLSAWNRIKFRNVKRKLMHAKKKLYLIIEIDLTCQDKDSYHSDRRDV